MRRLPSMLTLAFLISSSRCCADGFDGVWRSLGYGQMLEIAGDSVTVYQGSGRTSSSRESRERGERALDCISKSFPPVLEASLSSLRQSVR